MLVRRMATHDGRIHRILIEPEPQPVREFPIWFVRKGTREGWIQPTTVDGRPALRFLSHPPVVYQLTRPPGTWCVHCGLSLPRASAPGHVARRHPDVPSPDPEAPLGFRVDRTWLAVRVT